MTWPSRYRAPGGGLWRQHTRLPSGDHGGGGDAPCRIRTCDLVLRRDALYPAELRAPAEHRSGWARALGVWMARGNCPTTEVNRCVACVLWQRVRCRPCLCRRRPGGDAGAVDQQPAAGSPRGGGRAALLCRGLPGRPLLCQRLAQHRRDGRRLGASAQARRRRLVRHRRPVGRPGDELLERLGLHPLRPPRHRRAARAAHRRRARRQPRRALRAAADQPGRGRQDRDGQGRRPLRADERLPVGLHRRDAQRERQHRRPGRVHRRRPAVHRRRRPARARPSTTTRRSSPPTRTRPPARPRPPAATTAARSPAHVCPAERRPRRPARATTARSARAPAASCATR